jgi:spore maturation protein CgeB
MKILIIGSDYVWSVERIYRKYLVAAGAGQVKLFAVQNLFYSYYQQSVFHKFLFRTGVSAIYKKINDLIIAEIETFRPDIIWIFKGMEVLPSTLEWCRSKGIVLVNFNGDSPFIFSGRGSGNKYVTQSLPLYDLHFTYNLEIKGRLENQYGLKVGFLPFGFDVSESVYEECLRQEEINKVCFLGNPDKIRAGFIRDLAGRGIEIDVYGGDGWKELAGHPAITVLPHVYGDDFWKTLRRYRIQLNLMRPHNENSHNMRSFEVPGIGGVMLAPATTEHKMFFRDGEDAFLFSGFEDCVHKIRQLLTLRREETDKIRKQARQRSIDDGYNYEHRALTALQYFSVLHAQTGHPSF